MATATAEMKRLAGGPGEAGTNDRALRGHDSLAWTGRQAPLGIVSFWHLVGAATRRPDLSRGDIAVLWAILDRIGADGTAWPGYGRIAADTGLCRSTVTRCIRKLVASGLLQRDSGGPGRPNRYRPGRRTDAPRCEDEPSCSGASRRKDEPRVGAPTRLGVGAPTLPEPAPLNLLQEPARATAHSAAPTAQCDGETRQVASMGPAPPPAPESPVAKRINGAKPKKTAVRFPEFWASYPVKKDRAKAEKSWRTKDCDAIADEIIAHVRRMEVEDDQWRRGFIPHGSTYVSGERWTDEPQKDKDAATVTTPAPTTMGAAAALTRSESPLEAALGYIRQQHNLGAYGEGESGAKEMRRLMEEATEKHRATQTTTVQGIS